MAVNQNVARPNSAVLADDGWIPSPAFFGLAEPNESDLAICHISPCRRARISHLPYKYLTIPSRENLLCLFSIVYNL
jgi:hypothetical protein